MATKGYKKVRGKAQLSREMLKIVEELARKKLPKKPSGDEEHTTIRVPVEFMATFDPARANGRIPLCCVCFRIPGTSYVVCFGNCCPGRLHE